MLPDGQASADHRRSGLRRLRRRLEQLDTFHALEGGIDVLIHGGATGADSLAGAWASANAVPVQIYPVRPEHWQLYGRRAGNMRNSRMLRESKPDVVMAFPGRSGTRDMRRKAHAANVLVIDLAHV